MSTALINPETALIPAETMGKVLLQGDLERLTPNERLNYYKAVCTSTGLNPLTRPFNYIKLNGKLTLYAKRECTEQLRTIHGVSISIKSREVTEGCYVVTSGATLPNGRTDESIGAVPIEGLKGEARANALMKAETKSKRRVTLAICGLSFLDETEVDSVPSAVHMRVDPLTGAILEGSKAAAQEVADRKIREIKDRRAKEAAAQAVPTQPVQVYLPPSMQSPAEPTYEEVPLDEPPAAPDDAWKQRYETEMELTLAESIKLAEANRSKKKPGASQIEMLKAFGELKKRYKAIGMEQAYYAMLGQYGVCHSNEFPGDFNGMSQARMCYKAMTLDCADEEAYAAKEESKP
jgi:hypothetical protein